MNTRQKIALAVLNLLLIAELFIVMYLASKDLENMTLVFLKYFFILMIPTFIIGKIVIRRLRSKDIGGTVAEMPPHGPPPHGPQPHGPQPQVYSDQMHYQDALFKRPTYKSGDFKQVSKRREYVGRVCTVLLIVLFISFFDSCFARIRQPINVLNVLLGTSMKMNGPLEEKIKNVKDLTYESSSELIQLSIEDIYSGFWLGGMEWRGLLTVSPHITPEDYHLTVMPKIQTSPKPPLTFLIKVYQDELSLRKSSTSFIKRHSGISPWWVFAFFLSLTLLTVGIVLYLSTKIEHIMVKGGEAEVYWVKPGVAGIEIAFGMGSKHGIQLGDKLVLLNEERKPVGTVVVQKVTEKNSLAIAAIDCPVRVGYIVLIHKR